MRGEGFRGEGFRGQGEEYRVPGVGFRNRGEDFRVQCTPAIARSSPARSKHSNTTPV